MSNENVYEKKVYDANFPVELFLENREEEGLYFWSHWHEEMEILQVTEGMSKIVLNQQECILEKGSMVIVNSNMLHSGYVLQTPYKCRVISFNPEKLVSEITSLNSVYTSDVIKDSYANDLLEQLFREYSSQALAYIDTCKALLVLLLVHLTRNYVDASRSRGVTPQAKHNLKRFSQVMFYIEQHYDQNITNKYLADMMHLSEDHFSHLFRKNIGMAPQQYINTLRLHHARELIQAGEGTITEIARNVGFADYNHFGRQFKRYFHCTPKELYVEKLLSKQSKTQKNS